MNNNHITWKEERISQILNAIMKVSAGDYDTQIVPSEKGDEIDAIMVGLNMLAEEIKESKLSLEELLKLKTDRLTESERKFSALADFASEHIFIVNKNLEIEYVNTPGAIVFNASPEELIGKSIEELFPPQQIKIMKEELVEVFKKGITIRNEREFKFNNETVWLSTSLAPIYLKEKKEVISVLGISRDTTERKIVENLIEKANDELLRLNTEKDKFFSIIAHDLRSPFNGFIGLTEVIIEEIENLSTEDISRMAKEMNKSAINLYKLLKNLFEWAKMQRGTMDFELKDYSLKEIVDQAIGLIETRAGQKNITVVSSIPESIGVCVDENMIKSVFRNLLTNAIKFTRRGGKVAVKVKGTEGNKVEISVSDNGIGMSENDVKKLFKLGEKVSSPGTEGEESTGLGLVLCKEFIEKHQCKIWVESEEGKGSTFNFTLPLCSKKTA